MRKNKQKGNLKSFKERHNEYVDDEAILLTSEKTGHPERIVRRVSALETANFGGARRIADKVSEEEDYRLTKDAEMKIWKTYLDCAESPKVTDEELEKDRAELDEARSQRDRYYELWDSKIEKEDLEEETLDYKARLDPFELPSYFWEAFSKQNPALHHEFVEACKRLGQNNAVELWRLGVPHPFEKCNRYHGVDNMRQYLEMHLPPIIASKSEEAESRERERRLKKRDELKRKYWLKRVMPKCPDCTSGLIRRLTSDKTEFYCPKCQEPCYIPCPVCEQAFGTETLMEYSAETKNLYCPGCGLKQTIEFPPNLNDSTNPIAQDAHP